MYVKIISGIHGSRKINAPPGKKTHPMSERVRNALFNTLSGKLKNAMVLDAFAGTGALGLEALSRGSASVVFIEKDRLAQNILAENIEILGVAKKTKLIRTTVSNWLQTTAEKDFDIIFADPPYHDMQLSTVSKLFGLLKPGGIMVLSHPGRGEVPTKTGVVVVDNRSYGDAYLTFYRREGALE